SGQLVFEAAGFDRAMHPALLRRAGLPPPSPGTRVVALGHGARARRASDRSVALVVEHVVRNVVGAEIVPHLGFGPVGQRRELHDPAVVVIDLDLADVGAGGPLIASKSGQWATRDRKSTRL